MSLRAKHEPRGASHPGKSTDRREENKVYGRYTITQPCLFSFRGFAMPRAFTLIELLVVITIIVVLLALLTPALDKAMYQAELAVCGANLRAIANGAIPYA